MNKNMEKLIEAGNVIRWFHIDWELFGYDIDGFIKGANMQDLIFDLLLDMENAKEVNSGHTGVNVSFEDDKRSDEQIIKSIAKVIKPVVDK